MKKLVLPKTLFVRYVSNKLPEYDDNQYLLEFRTAYDAAVKGEERIVGVYELVETRKVSVLITEKLIDKKI